MYFGAIAPLRPMPFHPQPRPYAPQPRVVTREVIVRPPPQVIDRYHTVYRPGPVQTIVRPDYGAIQRAREAQANWDREHARLERMRDRESMARLALLQQQLLAAQQAAAAAQAAAQQPAVQTPLPPTVAPTIMPQPQPSVSPASPAVDLTPTQDAAAAADGGGDAGGGAEPAGHKPKHLVLFVGLIAVAGVGGYMLMKKKKVKKSAD